MSRAWRFCLVLLVIGLANVLAAQDYTIKRSTFIPSSYFVGDTVELRLGIRSDFADKMVVPQQLVQPSWGSIGDLRLIPGDGEVELRLQFTSFAVGTRSLPAINLGPVVIEGVNIFVSSLASESNGQLAPLREPAMVPELWGKLVAQVLVVLSVPLTAMLVVFWVWPRIRGFIRMRQETWPYRRFVRRLRLGKAEAATLDHLAFYAWLLGEVRLYLTERCHFMAMACTSAELEETLAGRIHHRETVDGLIEVFRHADRVKFAGELGSAHARHLELQVVEQAIGHIEQEERMRRTVEAVDAPSAIIRAGAILGRQVREGHRSARGAKHDSL